MGIINSRERNQMIDESIFEGASWEPLVAFLEKLPRPVTLVVWADPDGSRFEQEGLALVEALARRFPVLRYEQRDRVPEHPFYPVFGFMGENEAGVEVDYRVRLLGLPAGYQINSLVGAIQAVSFRASNLEARTRIQLSRLPAEAIVDIELFTGAEDEEGPLVATLAAGLAVASSQVRAFIVMADLFPNSSMRYSISRLPHTVINGRVHITGTLNEEAMLKQIARALS
jgi:alkyl hydroperoxide reductase subunit AhpF